jgi:hypothetical protein
MIPPKFSVPVGGIPRAVQIHHVFDDEQKKESHFLFYWTLAKIGAERGLKWPEFQHSRHAI